MTTTRRREAMQMVCHWCHVDIDEATSARTPLGVEGTPNGWYVCGPSCPERPNGARVYAAKVPVKVGLG